MSIDFILAAAHEHEASDIHLVPGHRPMVRVNTVMQPLELPILTVQAIERYMAEIASPLHRERFEHQQDVDLSYATEALGRYRVNIHKQRTGPAMALRAIRDEVPAIESLNLPDVVTRFATLPRGLVLVTGDTGSGKSTTLAAIIESINASQRKHIITLEDPIEYTFDSDCCLIEQRERGEDMPDFASGLKHALRQDPDIILVGEMRDLETTSLAISAAETGHLVLSTLHTASAAQTVERIVDMYPASQQNQIRSMLGDTLQAVVSQTLLPRVDIAGMVPAVEILLCTPAVRNLIRENRTFEIPNVIETSQRLGMTTLDASIASLYYNGMISHADAVTRSSNPAAMERAIAA
ncbi:MAG: type IV pilus twitching motility protein PilT [Phycisphaerales bacterium]|nr:type IV pilus twitching motility protein PilT [Phycisphaerales bacterium]